MKDRAENIIDGYYRRIGIRSVEFKGKDGFWLNGKPYPYPLIGANRHQDYAVIGNALPNSLHWRDAKNYVMPVCVSSVMPIIHKTLHLWMPVMNWDCLL